MNAFARALGGLAALLALAATASAEPPLPSGRFRVGGTGIMCVKEPCPRIGIMKDGTALRQRPIYSGRTPPRLTGSPAARAAIERAWTIEGCLIVEGAFVQPAAFDVAKIVGAC